MQYKFFVGIDVSKNTLDVGLINSTDSGLIKHHQVSNDDDGIAGMVNWLEQQASFSMEVTLFCLEHTGIYNYPLLQFFTRNSSSVWVENPMQIKKSLGLQRGKNDKVDAVRIANYAFRSVDRVKLWQPSRIVVDKLKHLSALRERLVETKKRLQTPVNELLEIGNDSMARILGKSMRKTMTGLDKDLKSVEQQMKDVIDGDDDLKKLYALVTSVVGIGFVTGVNLIVYTNEFRRFTNHRQFACYSGVAPFEHKSGSSIRGRTRVSPLANKKVKTNLHMASLTGIKLDEGLKAYYERKVAQGKNKMSVLNAIRNKLLSRVFAVVKRGEPYQKTNYRSALILS